ncbi:MAG: hypothetical protein FJ100_22800 [Deltaproteobacteria bacterium]|nr:hypothetical protein [Deltaproteobacteria bacterium]
MTAPLSVWRKHVAAVGSSADAGSVVGGGAGVGLALAVTAAFSAAGAGSVALAAVGTLGLALLGARLGRRHGPALAERYLDARQPRSLLTVRDDLNARVAALNESGKRIAALRAKLTADLAGAQTKGALEVLQAAAQASLRQHDRLSTELWRVSLAQWQNQLQPALATWRTLDDRGAEAEIARVERARLELQRLVSGWMAQPLANTDSGKQVLVHAGKLDQACEALKRALLLRQALAIAEAAPGVADAFDRSTAAPDVQGQLDVLREREELGEFLSGGTDSADEVHRLQAEQEAVGEVERLLGADK